jgi:hypothetical protein
MSATKSGITASNQIVTVEKRQEGKMVLEHPLKDTIDRMLFSGWSPARVCNWLNKEHPELKDQNPSERTIRYYLDNHVEAKLVLPPSVYENSLKRLDISIDALQELYNLIEFQKRRMGYLIELEDTTKSCSPQTVHEKRLLKEMLVE